MPERAFSGLIVALSVPACVAWAGPDSLDASRAYEAELAADAAGRTSLLTSAQSSGRDDRGFFLSDGLNHRLTLGGYLQLRYLVNNRQPQTARPDEERFTTGFQTARTVLQMHGTLVRPEFSFFLQSNFSRSTGEGVLEDSYVQWRANPELSFRLGQFKMPFRREELVADTYQLGVERSFANGAFSEGRTQGVMTQYELNDWSFSVAFTDGERADNSDFDTDREADWAATGRAEYKWAGEWLQFRDLTSFRGSSYAGLVGAAFTYAPSGDTGGTVNADTMALTIDASLEGDGWNVLAAYDWRDTTSINDAPRFIDRAFLLQGGYFFADSWEGIARYELLLPEDSGLVPNNDAFNVLTVGVNHYLIPRSHAAKFSADLSWLLDSQRDSSSLVNVNTLRGVLADIEGDQFILRLQFQMMF